MADQLPETPDISGAIWFAAQTSRIDDDAFAVKGALVTPAN
jgi:hypothetical protein